MLSLLPIGARGVGIEPAGFAGKHFAGARFGVWTASENNTIYYAGGDSLAVSGSSAYGEFFYAHRISRPIAIELSLGILSRGDYRYYTSSEVLLGSVILYPILLTAKIYPLFGMANARIFPYLQAGGGVIYGKQDAIDYYYGVAFTNESETKLAYTLGAGIDWPVADQIGLCINFKYIPAEFKNDLAGVKDYSGWQLSFGVGYIFGSKGN
jgi:hypothetical protein